MNAFEIAGLQMRGANTFPHDVQMAFERADLQENSGWLNANYDKWQKQMNTHALASFGAFEWEFYRKWLQQNSSRVGAGDALANFKRHPAYSQIAG